MVSVHPFGLCVGLSLLLTLACGALAAGLSFRRQGPLAGLGLGLLLVGICAGADPWTMLLERVFPNDLHLAALDLRSVGVLLVEAAGLVVFTMGISKAPRAG